MADKISELTNFTPPIDANIIPIVDTTAGATKGLTWANIKATLKTYFDSLTTTLTNKTFTSPIFQGTVDGWTLANETPTYNAANKLTVASGAAAKYAIGDRIRWKQGAGYLYGVLIVIADTLLTIATNTDFVVANSAITDFYYSHEASPIGYPQWFTLAAPTFNVAFFDNGSGGQPTTTKHRMSILGRRVEVYYKGDGTKAGTNVNIVMSASTMPVPVNTTITTLGVCFTVSPVLGGWFVFDANPYDCVMQTAITDNSTMANFGFVISYEI